MPEFIEQTITERQITCKFCGSTLLWKNGTQNQVQYYRCSKCDHKTNGQNKFIGKKYDKVTVMRALEDYYGGSSFGIVKNKFDNIEQKPISKSTVWYWVNFYTGQVIPYVRALKPTKIGYTWHVDETMINQYGNDMWLWAVIDEKTRMILSCVYSRSRDITTATHLFREAYLFAGHKPDTIFSDGLPAYPQAIKNVFYSRYKKDRVEHIITGSVAGNNDNNLIERWHEYVKQRTKIMRYFKQPKSARTILNGIVINYNYLWEHSVLGNIPPAQIAGIDIIGLDIKNWGDLLELAMSPTKIKPNPIECVWYEDEVKRFQEIGQWVSAQTEGKPANTLN